MFVFAMLATFLAFATSLLQWFAIQFSRDGNLILRRTRQSPQHHFHHTPFTFVSVYWRSRGCYEKMAIQRRDVCNSKREDWLKKWGKQFNTICLLTVIVISYCTVPSTIWPIFSKFLIFCRLISLAFRRVK